MGGESHAKPKAPKFVQEAGTRELLSSSSTAAGMASTLAAQPRSSSHTTQVGKTIAKPVGCQCRFKTGPRYQGQAQDTFRFFCFKKKSLWSERLGCQKVHSQEHAFGGQIWLLRSLRFRVGTFRGHRTWLRNLGVQPSLDVVEAVQAHVVSLAVFPLQPSLSVILQGGTV